MMKVKSGKKDGFKKYVIDPNDLSCPVCNGSLFDNRGKKGWAPFACRDCKNAFNEDKTPKPKPEPQKKQPQVAIMTKDDWKAKDYKVITYDNPYDIASVLALQDWSYSDTAIVAVIKEEHEQPEVDHEGYIEDRIPGGYTIKEINFQMEIITFI